MFAAFGISHTTFALVLWCYQLLQSKLFDFISFCLAKPPTESKRTHRFLEMKQFTFNSNNYKKNGWVSIVKMVKTKISKDARFNSLALSLSHELLWPTILRNLSNRISFSMFSKYIKRLSFNHNTHESLSGSIKTKKCRAILSLVVISTSKSSSWWFFYLFFCHVTVLFCRLQFQTKD